MHTFNSSNPDSPQDDNFDGQRPSDFKLMLDEMRQDLYGQQEEPDALDATIDQEIDAADLSSAPASPSDNDDLLEDDVPPEDVNALLAMLELFRPYHPFETRSFDRQVFCLTESLYSLKDVPNRAFGEDEGNTVAPTEELLPASRFDVKASELVEREAAEDIGSTRIEIEPWTPCDDPSEQKRYDPNSDFIEPVVTGPVQSLYQLNLDEDTIRHFGLTEIAGSGIIFPADFLGPDLRPGRETFRNVAQSYRLRSSRPGTLEYEWQYIFWPHPPVIYNVGVLRDNDRLQRGLYLVMTEAEVWFLHQLGYAAICIFGPREDPAPMVDFLRRMRFKSLKIIYPNDALGRMAAILIYNAFEEKDLEHRIEILVLNVRPGARITDLYSAVGFDPQRFQDALVKLPRVSLSLLRIWAKEPRYDPTSQKVEIIDKEEDQIQLLGQSELEASPLPECAIDGVLLAHKVTIMTGMHNLGKSAIAMDMALSTGCGVPWCGLSTTAGVVTYIMGEGREGAGIRMKGWMQEKGITEIPNFHVVDVPIQIHEETQRKRLIKTMLAVAPQHALLVVDTLAQCSIGLNDSSDDAMKTYVACLMEISRETGAAVLLIHHNNRANDYRGSSVLPANSDGHIQILGTSGKEHITLRVAKIKDFPDGHEVELRRRIVTLNDRKDASGRPVTTVVFLPDSEAVGEEKGGEAPAPAKRSLKSKSTDGTSSKEDAILQALRTLCGASNTKGGSPAGATAGAWKIAAGQMGVSSATFDRIKKSLLESGKVRCDRPGKVGVLYSIAPSKSK